MRMEETVKDIKNIGTLLNREKKMFKLYQHNCDIIKCNVISPCEEPCRWCRTTDWEVRKERN